MRTELENRQYQEAIQRLKILEQQGIITDLDICGMFKNGELCFSVPMNLMGELVGVINPVYANIELGNIITCFSREYSHLMPYFIMIIRAGIMGTLVSILYVSDMEDEWDMDRAELMSKNLCAYTYSVDNDSWDVGYIEYDIFAGGPIRVS